MVLARREVDVVLAAARNLELQEQALALFGGHRECGLPLAQRLGHGQARPVEHAIVALREIAGDMTTLHAINGGTPQSSPFCPDQAGSVFERRRRILGTQLPDEIWPEVLKAGRLHD